LVSLELGDGVEVVVGREGVVDVVDELESRRRGPLRVPSGLEVFLEDLSRGGDADREGFAS
jgi:hypothetical protein